MTADPVLQQIQHLAGQKRFAEALELIEQATEAGCDQDHSYHFLYATILDGLGRYQVALGHCERASAADADNLDYKKCLAKLLCLTNQQESGIKLFLLLREVDCSEELILVAKTLFVQARSLEAEIFYNEALQHNRDAYDAIAGLGHCQQTRGNLDDALSLYTRAQQLKGGKDSVIDYNLAFMQIAKYEQ